MVFSFRNDINIEQVNNLILEGIANGQMYNLTETIKQVEILFKMARDSKFDTNGTQMKIFAKELSFIQPADNLGCTYLLEFTIKSFSSK